MPAPGPAVNETATARRPARSVGALVAIAVLGSGCSWVPKSRPARPREMLELESFTVTLPDGPGWRVGRGRDADWRRLEAIRFDDGGRSEQQVLALERLLEGPVPRRDEEAADIRAEALRLVGDPKAVVTELPAAPDPRFGPSAILTFARAEESDASAGLLLKRVSYAAVLQFVPPQAPDRLCHVRWEQAARRGAALDDAEQRWGALVADIALRPVDVEAVRSAARPDFPKSFEPGLARRSLTLPEHGFQFAWGRDRWIAPGGWAGGGTLSYGITDRVEVSLPGFFRYAFGEPEAILRPEVVLAGGWSRYEHDAARGNVWGGAVGAAARKRLGANVTAIAGGTFEATHAPKTGENALYGGGAAGVRWEPAAPRLLAQWVSLGLEVGYASRDVGLPSRRLAWVGGRTTPLVTVHLPLVDLGLTGGMGWDGDRIGALAGFALALTL